ncbi:MAG: dihydroorotase [bacterium]|nr:dihydroorotase [bacterium]
MSSNLTIIKNGHLIDPAAGRDGYFDVRIDDGQVAEVSPNIEPSANETVLDAAGCYVLPGLIDMHVHLREPGGEAQETIASGTRAAAHGGFTSVVCKANTEMPLDNPAALEFVQSVAEREGIVNVFAVGSVTAGLSGYAPLSEIGGLKEYGAVAISDDGVALVKSDVMAEALKYSETYDILVITHAEDYGLSGGGSVNEGATSAALGDPGIPAEAEELVVARDIQILKHYGGHLHIDHVSTAATLRHIRNAREEGLDITSETTPHYLIHTSERVGDYDTNAKMNPPLRTEADRAALREACADGTIDTIVTDHAPHTSWAKDRILSEAPFGIVGLETSLFLIYTYLVREGVMELPRMVEMMSAFPAKRLGLVGRGTVQSGSIADVTVFDPEPKWVINPDDFLSKGKNTPFAGMEVYGSVKWLLVGGKIVTESDKV